jgi:hypothetical protein
MATRPGDPEAVPPIPPATWDDTTAGCTPYSGPIKEFDWLILDGGGNDLDRVCEKPFWGVPTCDVHCTQQVVDIFYEMLVFLSYIIDHDMPADRIILMGYYKYQANGLHGWFNRCVDLSSQLADIFFSPTGMNLIFPEDWVEGGPGTTANYQNFGWYCADTVHPSHGSIGLISQKVAEIIDAD